MTIQEAIQVRHSVRQYKNTAIEAEKIAQLQALIDQSNSEAGLHMQLVVNEPKAFAGGLAKYGKFSGVGNYIAMIAPKGKDVELGYYGEQVVLLAQTLGLNTCWVGLLGGTDVQQAAGPVRDTQRRGAQQRHRPRLRCHTRRAASAEKDH